MSLRTLKLKENISLLIKKIEMKDINKEMTIIIMDTNNFKRFFLLSALDSSTLDPM